MNSNDQRNRLVAILAADAAGYSLLMSLDAFATVATLEAAREIFRAQIEAKQGRVIDMPTAPPLPLSCARSSSAATSTTRVGRWSRR